MVIQEKDSQLLKIQIELAQRELARRNIFDFTKYTMPEFEATPFHEVYYKILDMFAKKLIKKLMVTMPPQHGKSEGSSRRLPAYIFGKRQDDKIAVLSYAASFAQGFNQDIQRIMESPEYRILFPDTKLPTPRDKTYKCNTTKFELPGHRGWLKAIGRGGPLTGDKVDIAIMDDLYKDPAEGNSPVIRAAVIKWYTGVVRKRLHNDSQQLIVFTRWHEDDLIGHLEEKETVIEITSWKQLENIDNTYWYKINFPALMNKAPTDIDPRKMEEALYPSKHSKEAMEEERAFDPELFESMNQGDPTPTSGLLYTTGFKTYRLLPRHTRKVFNYTDTADKGKDNLCSINGIVGLDNYIYVTDLIYTKEPQEVTEPETAALLKRGYIKGAIVESNNGGRAFARNVDRLCNYKIVISTFHQSDNKESRIVTNSAECQRIILFPEGWEAKWPQFHKALTRFKKLFTANTHDDAPDALTGLLEYSGLCANVNSALYRS